MAPPTSADLPSGAEARARASVEHLQAAARELIEAARAALDVAEELVDDPERIASLAGTLAALGDVARQMTGTGGWSRPPGGARDRSPHASGRGGEGGRDGGDEPRVQHIRVT